MSLGEQLSNGLKPNTAMMILRGAESAAL